MSSPEHPAWAVMRRINQAWLEGRPRDVGLELDPKMVMVLPGLAGAVEGREAVVAGFVDYCENARTLAYRERNPRVDVLGDAAVVACAFDMAYERAGSSYRATGTDLWVFRQDSATADWRAVWRMMTDLAEVPYDGSPLS